jgi:transposase
MHIGRFVFAQIIDFIPERDFRRIVAQYGGEYKISRFSCWDQLLCMSFAQITFRESLRDIEDCLRPRGDQLYHLGLRGSVARSTLADANATRDWRIFKDLALLLITRARKLYADQPLSVDIDGAVYAIDSTTIDLCLAIFPWARFRKKKGAVKVHTLLDLHGPIPVLVHVTDGRVHDVNWLDALVFEARAFYLLDRGYVDFARLWRIEGAAAFFVTRAKSNLQFYCCRSHSVVPGSGVVCDQAIRLTIAASKKSYPGKLRRIVFVDPDTNKTLVFLTNNFDLSALEIALLYKARWQIELFFKWLKQHLRIKVFFGREPNAVKTQLWCAVAIYTLLLIIRKKLALEVSIHTILTVFSVNVFEQVAIHELFTGFEPTNDEAGFNNQLTFSY